jgi:PAS domain S-box-containing protein
MIDLFRHLRLDIKVALLGVGGVLITAAALVCLAVWQSGQYNILAQGEVDTLIESDLDHITEGVYNLVRTENETVQQQVDYNLNVARHILAGTGRVGFSAETTVWTAVNQFTNRKSTVRLPKMTVGGRWLGRNTDPSVRTIVVDDVVRLVGDTATVFQRMNEQGDMIRVATNVTNEKGRRAIGTYIPAVHADGTPNPVIATVMKGGTYHGRAFVVDTWYLAAYEPIRDGAGRLVGMLYVGVRQKSVELRLNRAILQTRVGKTGYVYVLGGKGKERGRYIISQRGERDGEDIWDSQDSDGRYVIQAIVNKAIALKPGEFATERYRWQNPDDPSPRWKIARLAYYEPWDWVIGTSVYEDELQTYRNYLSSGRTRMTTIMGLAGLAITVIVGLAGVFLAWTITRPVEKLKTAAETIIAGDLDHVVDIHSKDEIGALARTFNAMTERLKQTMDGLLKSEEKYRTLVETTGDLVFMVGRRGLFTFVNRQLENLTGLSSQELMGRPFTDILPPEWHEKAVDHFKRGIAGEVIPPYEVEIVHTGGEKTAVELLTATLYDGNGKPVGRFGVGRDITERKRAEEALRISEQRLSDLIDFLPDATLAIDKDKRIIIWNRAIEEMTGIPAKEMIGKGDYAYTVPFYGVARPQLMDLFWEPEHDVADKYPILEKEGDNLVIEVFCPALHDGKGAFIWAKASPLRDSEGRLIGAIECLRDINERKQAEEKLRRSEQNYRSVIENVQDVFYRSDAAGNLIMISPSFVTLLGYDSVEDCLGKPIAETFYYDPDKRTEFLRELQAKGRVTAYEVVLKKKDGTPVTVETNSQFYFDDAGRVAGVDGIFRDVTARNQAEEVRRKLENQLIQSQKMEAIGTLAGGIAHDFNNILAAIIGYTELYKEAVTDRPKVHHAMDEVLKAAGRAKELVKHILTFSRKAEPEKRLVKLYPIVEEAIKFMRASLPTTIEIRQTIERVSDSIMCDPVQIHQVLMNLCTNAGHAMKDTGGVLEIGLKEVSVTKESNPHLTAMKHGRYLELSVRDTGEGIPPENLSRIFEPYFTTKEMGKGTGLGLAVVHGIVKDHHGEIKVYSEVGKGTVFRVYLPLSDKTAEDGAGSADEALPGNGEIILFIDDEKLLADLSKELLEMLGYRVFAESDPLRAIQMFKDENGLFDIVITDKTMPHMTGFDVAREIRAIRPDIPIILCSGFQEKEDVEKLAALGISLFVTKPIRRTEIAQAIRHVLDGGIEKR